MSTPPVLAIDMGTSCIRVAVFRNGKVEVIPNELGNRSTPSCVSFTDTGPLLGEFAKSQAANFPKSTMMEPKRYMGRRLEDPAVQKDIVLERSAVRVCAEAIDALYQAPYMDRLQCFTPSYLNTMHLQAITKFAKDYLGEVVSDAVLTVPGYFHKFQLSNAMWGAYFADWNIMQVINEHTAVALAYSLEHRPHGQQNLVVFDLGSGTLDVAVLSVAASSGFPALEDVTVLATAVDTHLGGEDFDRRLLKLFSNEFKRTHRKALGPSSTMRLKLACEEAKRTLSSASEASVAVDIEGIEFSSKITRARFNELCADLFRHTLDAVEWALEEAKLDKSSVDEVVLVGGSTHIPKVRQLLQAFFDGKELNTRLNPDEAVVVGAAVYVQAAGLKGDPDHRKAGEECNHEEPTPSKYDGNTRPLPWLPQFIADYEEIENNVMLTRAGFPWIRRLPMPPQPERPYVRRPSDSDVLQQLQLQQLQLQHQQLQDPQQRQKQLQMTDQELLWDLMDHLQKMQQQKQQHQHLQPRNQRHYIFPLPDPQPMMDTSSADLLWLVTTHLDGKPKTSVTNQLHIYHRCRAVVHQLLGTSDQSTALRIATDLRRRLRHRFSALPIFALLEEGSFNINDRVRAYVGEVFQELNEANARVSEVDRKRVKDLGKEVVNWTNCEPLMEEWGLLEKMRDFQRLCRDITGLPMSSDDDTKRPWREVFLD